MDGIEATRAIAADPRLAGVRVVILTTWELDESVFDRAGRAAAGHPGGGRRRGPAVPGRDRQLIADLVARPDHRAGPAPDMAWLTDREREVVGLVAPPGGSQTRSRPT
ncbi:MAG TPA: hypothetical protein VHM23_28680 [Actinomycetota bacterium]|jgi:hypothetical protein|nr:hypothetical protein [Actinomycetota bacterium]